MRHPRTLPHQRTYLASVGLARRLGCSKMNKAARLVCLADVPVEKRRPFCHHRYFKFNKNLKCSNCEKICYFTPKES
jgi:hypothetical protein